jgi:lysosomal acid phosphatase
MFLKKIMHYGFALFVLFISSSAFAQDKMIFAVDVIRHGDRTPAQKIPKSPYPWQQGLGELTALGMQQEYQLGQQFRKKYVDEYHLLPEHFAAQTVFVRSTDMNRTLMSAESVLLGLYPLNTGPKISTQTALPEGYQPIPIHTVAKQRETLLIPDEDKEKYDALLKKYIFSQESWQAKNSSLKKKFRIWSQVTGMKISSLDELNLLSDNLFIRQLHNIPYPAGISVAEAEEMISVGRWSMVAKFKSREMDRVTSHELLQKIMTYMQQASQQKTPLKYVLFSAHDSTIMSLMGALGVPLADIPHYAADLNFALFQNAANQFYIRVTYNGEPVRIPDCHSENCSFRDLA